MPFTRRAFLASVPAVVAAAAPRKPVVAAHPWVYAATQPKYDIYPILDTIFADMKYAGMDAIELMHTALRPAEAVERISELSARHKLPVIGTSYDAPMWNRAQHAAILDGAESLIPRLAKVGGRLLGTSVGDARRKKTNDELDAQAEMVQKLIGICNKNGVVLNLHNHIYEVADGEYDLNGTLKRVPDVKLGPDLDWLRGAGVDPVDFIHRRGKQMVYAHLRDRGANNIWTEAIGEGNTDFAAIAGALRAADFQGDVGIELAHPAGFKPTRPLRESLKISREYIRKTMGW